MSKKNTRDPPVKKNAFVHKLYSMLQDPKLSHLIWWTTNSEQNTFALYPGKEFATALTGYFKHGNVASFVRQLHMYGFHKVTDPSQMNHPAPPAQISSSSSSAAAGGSTANPDADPKAEVAPVWEFKHSSGKFKKDDETSLIYIKRRSSSNSARNGNSGPNGNNENGLDEDLSSPSPASFEAAQHAHYAAAAAAASVHHPYGSYVPQTYIPQSAHLYYQPLHIQQVVQPPHAQAHGQPLAHPHPHGIPPSALGPQASAAAQHYAAHAHAAPHLAQAAAPPPPSSYPVYQDRRLTSSYPQPVEYPYYDVRHVDDRRPFDPRRLLPPGVVAQQHAQHQQQMAHQQAAHAHQAQAQAAHAQAHAQAQAAHAQSQARSQVQTHAQTQAPAQAPPQPQVHTPLAPTPVPASQSPLAAPPPTALASLVTPQFRKIWDTASKETEHHLKQRNPSFLFDPLAPPTSSTLSPMSHNASTPQPINISKLPSPTSSVTDLPIPAISGASSATSAATSSATISGSRQPIKLPPPSTIHRATTPTAMPVENRRFGNNITSRSIPAAKLSSTNSYQHVGPHSMSIPSSPSILKKSTLSSFPPMSINQLLQERLRPSLIELHFGTTKPLISAISHDSISSLKNSIFLEKSSLSSISSVQRNSSFGSFSNNILHKDSVVGPHDMELPLPPIQLVLSPGSAPAMATSSSSSSSIQRGKLSVNSLLSSNDDVGPRDIPPQSGSSHGSGLTHTQPALEVTNDVKRQKYD